MATLRALVGAGSELAFMGFVVFVPIGWAVVLVVASATPYNFAEPSYRFRHLPACTQRYLTTHGVRAKHPAQFAAGGINKQQGSKR